MTLILFMIDSVFIIFHRTNENLCILTTDKKHTSDANHDQHTNENIKCLHEEIFWLFSSLFFLLLLLLSN